MTIAAPTSGLRKRSNGIAGWGERRSIATKATAATTKTANAATAGAAPIPRCPASITAKVSAPTATIAAAWPGRSSGVRSRGERGPRTLASTATAPTGRLTKKIHAPVRGRGQQAAEHRPGGERDPADRRPGRDPLRPGGGIGVGQADERERRGQQERRRGPLHDPRGEQDVQRRRRAAGQRGQGEGDHPRRVAARRADSVAERAAGEQQGGEGDHVGIDDPLQVAEIRAEVVADRRQRDVDDRHVEDDDEEAE